MITAPTRPGRRFVNRAVDILIEEEMGAPITRRPDGLSMTRIITLTNRETGAQIQLDEDMLDFIVDQTLPPAMRHAKLIQSHLDVKGGDERVHVLIRTANAGLRSMTVEADIETETGLVRGLVTADLAEGGGINPASIRIEHPRRRAA